MNKVKAIFIDVINKTITDIEIEKGIEAVFEKLDCTAFDAICPKGAPAGLTVYIDDEGLLREPPLGAFYVRGFEQVLSGHGLIVGTDDEGETVDAPCTSAQMKVNIRFEDTHYLPEPGFIFLPQS